MNRKRQGVWDLPFAVLVTLAITCIITSCYKKDTSNIARPADIASLSNILDGEIFSGRLEAVQEEDGIAFVLNDDKEIFVLEKLSPENLITCGTIEHAEVLYSNAGLIVKNVETNRIWAYANNDNDSKKKFKKAESSMGESPFLATIYGHTKIRF